MRATGIRFKTLSVKPDEKFLENLCQTIILRAAAKGFNTEAHTLNGSAIKIGLHMASFRINTAMLGYNGRISRFVSSPKGYKRTNVPTWEQRVEFNDLVNDVFDKYGLLANIKSGCFTVRDKKKGRHNEYDWENQTPSWMGYHGDMFNGMGELCSRIVTEKEAREECDSDRREAEHKAATAESRRESARNSRQRRKLFEQATRVTVAGFSSWGSKAKNNGKKLTHAQFANLLGKLDSYDRRRVMMETVRTTAALASKPALSLVQGGAAC